MKKKQTVPQYSGATKICLEKANSNNPYQAGSMYLAGYNIEDIAEKKSFAEVIFLMFTGELSRCAEDIKLLEMLMILLSIPSPRHPAARSAMNAGVCKANAEHLLPISLMTLGGSQSGALEVQECYRFINNKKDTIKIEVLVNQLIEKWDDKSKHIAPGFGQYYGDLDPLSNSFFNKLLKIKPEGKTMSWVSTFISQLSGHNVGILDIGLAACIFHELSLGERESVGIYQLLRAPGLLAYGMEQSHKPVSAIPMLEDSQYELINK